jgi:hypothetical protein
MKTCNNCTPTDINVNVPYVVHEAEVSRQERQIKRMWIALIVLAVALFLTNLTWIGVFNSYDYSSEETIYQQDGEGTNIIGDSNEVNNGAESNNSQTQEN